jgi:integrase/recombinase XerD
MIGQTEQPMTDKVVWYACDQAARRAGIQKPVHPHTLRHYAGFRTIPGELDFGLIGGSLAHLFSA